MPCPIHLWVPLAAAAVPVARVLRNHLTGMDFGSPSRDKKRTRKNARPAREVKRWAPVGVAGTSSTDAEHTSG